MGTREGCPYAASSAMGTHEGCPYSLLTLTPCQTLYSLSDTIGMVQMS